jgi:Uma2 family endonuclease
VEYREAGVREYWIIDRFERKMTVFRQDSSGTHEVLVPEDGVYRTPLLPGFELILAALLGVADQWGEAGE